MRTARATARPAKPPVIHVDHMRVQDDPEYRHEMRERLAAAVDAAEAAQSIALLPDIRPVHEPSGSCCYELWELTLARLTGSLQSASRRPRH
jgi:hypothetical protein